jgi:pimeloyl-ACP methyl ester carboxylesterase
VRRLLVTVGLALALTAGCGSNHQASSGTTTTAVRTATTSTTSLPATTEVAGSAIAGAGAFLGSVHTVPADGITMSYRQFGSGPELVLAAGEGSPMSYWPITTLLALSQHWHVTMYDYRGLGLTTDDLSEPLSMEKMGDDLAELIGALGLHKPTIFGWSTGGEIALVAAIRHPAAVGRLAVTGAMPGGPTHVPTPPATQAVFEDPNTSPVTLLGLVFGSDSAAQSAYIADLGSVPQSVVSAATTQRYTDCENAYLDGHDYSTELKALKVPTLVMNGTEDQLVPPMNANVIAGFIPHAQLALEPGGHGWFMQHPDVFLPLLQKFIGQH